MTTETTDIKEILKDVTDDEEELREEAAAHLQDEWVGLERVHYRHCSRVQLGFIPGEGRAELLNRIEEFVERVVAIHIVLGYIDADAVEDVTIEIELDD